MVEENTDMFKNIMLYRKLVRDSRDGLILHRRRLSKANSSLAAATACTRSNQVSYIWNTRNIELLCILRTSTLSVVNLFITFTIICLK